LKVQKVKDIGDKPVYEVIEVKNLAASKEKLDDLLKRMGKKT